MKVEAWKCDSCEALIARASDVYVLKFETIGTHRACAEMTPETREIIHHFCEKCARGIRRHLKQV